jgi:hypothetical protein
MASLRWVAVLVTLLLSVGCEPRGYISFDPAAGQVGEVATLFVATTRKATPGFEIFSRERSQELGFARFDVSVPPDREPGTVIYPEELPGDPRTDFLTVSGARFNGSGNFLAAVLQRPVGDRRVVVFVHGYNNTFSEGLYRQAQMLHDFGTLRRECPPRLAPGPVHDDRHCVRWPPGAVRRPCRPAEAMRLHWDCPAARLASLQSLAPPWFAVISPRAAAAPPGP